MRLLLAEDERSLSDALVRVFTSEKYDVDAVYDGESALDYALSGIYDVILLDILMPKMKGTEVLKELRKREVATPVLMLTALSSSEDKVAGLDLGADDYLTKPFSISELLARVRALIRRRGQLVSDNKLNYQNISLDMSTYKLSSQSGNIKLSVKEFEIMRYLLERPTFVAKKEELILKVWGYDSEFESNNLEAYMSFLRKKLKQLGAEFTINSVRGVGYELSSPKD